jgi:hypothetical protein
VIDDYRFRGSAFFGVAVLSVFVIAAPAAASAQALPNPYRLVDGWAKLPGGREIGAVGDVDIDVDGRHVWAVLRCDAGGDKFGYECLDSELAVVVKFALDGNAVASFGGGMSSAAHGLEVARSNVWVMDARTNAPRALPRGRGRKSKPGRSGGAAAARHARQTRQRRRTSTRRATWSSRRAATSSSPTGTTPRRTTAS